MRRTHILATLLASALLALALPATASAQDDLRGIVPYIMLVVDTSGSMERQAVCPCETPSCTECLPRCNMTNDPMTGDPPPEKKNRWAVTLEALTGEFNNFECDAIQRTAANGMTYDVDYTFPYYQPWRCGGGTSGTPCAFDNGALLSQESNGILDLNVSGIRFGLMTFDGVATYGRDTQLTEAQFEDARSEGIDGMWSYAGKKPYRYPNCEHTYFMDTGSRSNSATEGALISLESCSGPGPRGTPGCEEWCTACPGTQDTVNKDIQETLLATRPFGSTPIAAALDDLYYHFNDDLSDDFQQCRDRYAILITDGRPDDDYRANGCDCYEDGNPSDCGGPPNDPTEMRCPYPLPEQVAQDLVEGRGTDGAMVERLYVLGLALDDQLTRDRIERIADAGCTGTAEECEIGETGKQSILADNLDTLRTAVQVIVEASNKPVSRTTPVFSDSGDPAEPQYQFNTALRLPTQANQPWHGVLERRRFVCAAADTDPSDFEPLSESEGDLFHENLDNQPSSTRRILTALPPTFNKLILESPLTRVTPSFCASTGSCTMRDLRTEISDPDRLRAYEATDQAHSQAITSWLYADPGSPREGVALGAIYHSTPVVSTPPRFDTTDISFNQYRRLAHVSGRPRVLYVGTTDGFLHAFSTSDYDRNGISAPGATHWRDLVPGEELWSFIPPMLLDDMRTNLTTQQFFMDAPPLLKTVNINEALGPNGYRQLLVMGMRGGGNAYIALDVTDPFEPRFLWQFTDPAMGKTYGQPAVVQAQFMRNGTLKKGAVAILPGGVGQTSAGDPSCDGGTTESMRNGSAPYETLIPDPSTLVVTGEARHRFDVRCWTPMGRALYFLDAEDGYVLKVLHRQDPLQLPPFSPGNQPIFPSPLVSAPAAFPDEIGAYATRVFITDADGVIWRVDMRDLDPVPSDPMRGWTARPFHDVFWGTSPASGELTYEAPLVTIDEQGRPVVIVGTGDTGNFMKPTVENRVVSLTEVETLQPLAEPEHFQAQMNWELRTKTGTVSTRDSDGNGIIIDGLAPSELVTGPMALFEGQLFIGTFIAVANSANVCDLGRGRMFAVHYNRPDARDANPSGGGSTASTHGPLRINAADPDDTNSIVNILRSDSRGDNVKISGISLVQVPSCTDTSATYSDPWTPSYAAPNAAKEPDLRMVAHADDPRDRGNNTVQQRGGSQISSVEKKLRPPARYTRITSWAATVD